MPAANTLRGISGSVVAALVVLTPLGGSAGVADPLPICHARIPVVSHAWARAIPVRPADLVRRIAAAAISNEDHADLLLKLGLLQGHLMVGHELIAAGQIKLALPHFGHPIRELYDDIAPMLDARGLDGFDTELIALEALAAGQPGSAAMQTQYEQVLRIVAAARATVPAPLLDDERFMLGALGELTEVAASDYNQSIEAGRIAKPVEYNDSRGYLEYAELELHRMEQRRGGARLQAARGALTEMQAIVGSLLPPETPLASTAEYREIVARFKANAAAGA